MHIYIFIEPFISILILMVSKYVLITAFVLDSDRPLKYLYCRQKPSQIIPRQSFYRSQEHQLTLVTTKTLVLRQIIHNEGMTAIVHLSHNSHSILDSKERPSANMHQPDRRSPNRNSDQHRGPILLYRKPTSKISRGTSWCEKFYPKA